MTASTNVPYWVVALRVGCVLSQVIAASGDLSLKLSLTPEYKFTNNGLSRPHVLLKAKYGRGKGCQGGTSPLAF